VSLPLTAGPFFLLSDAGSFDAIRGAMSCVVRWLAAPSAGSLYIIRKAEYPVSPAGADARALAPHSLRERTWLAAHTATWLAAHVASHGAMAASASARPDRGIAENNCTPVCAE
jgi:hypothetical protein